MIETIANKIIGYRLNKLVRLAINCYRKVGGIVIKTDVFGVIYGLAVGATLGVAFEEVARVL